MKESNKSEISAHCSSSGLDGVCVCVCVYPSDPGLEGELSDDMEVTDTTDSGLWDDGMVKERTIERGRLPRRSSDVGGWNTHEHNTTFSSLKEAIFNTFMHQKIVRIQFWWSFPPLSDTVLWLPNLCPREMSNNIC